MSAKSDRYKVGHRSSAPSTAPISPDARAARTAEIGAEQGASPSNTAPDNCNSLYFQALRWGVDSLYLSYPGQLSESTFTALQALKKLAQAREDSQVQAQYQLGKHCFEVKDKGSGLFPFTLEDDAFQIRLASHKAKSLPMAYVRIASRYLSHKSPSDAEHHLRELLQPLGDLEYPKVSRIDLFVDFVCPVDMEGFSRQAWVTKASAISQYAQDQVFTGWLIGAGSTLMARLYCKTIEIQKSGKTYLETLWREAGWDGVSPVWRLEFQFKREVLDQLGLEGLPSVLGNLNGLWSYASTEWLKLTVPSETDQTRSRWPIHPLWGYLSSVDWETTGGPLLREYSASRAPSRDWIGKRALSLLVSIAALSDLDGPSDLEEALDKIGDAASQALADQAVAVGIPDGKLFWEKVALLKRKYNTGMNAAPEEAAEEVPGARDYRRATQGY